MALSLCRFFLIHSIQFIAMTSKPCTLFSLLNFCHSFKKEQVQCKTIQGIVTCKLQCCLLYNGRVNSLNSCDIMEFSSWNSFITWSILQFFVQRKRVLRSSWIVNECNLSCKIVKNGFLHWHNIGRWDVVNLLLVGVNLNSVLCRWKRIFLDFNGIGVVKEG